MSKLLLTLRTTLAAMLLISLAGCFPRTAERVMKWKEKGEVEKIILALDDDLKSVRVAAIKSLGELQATEASEKLATFLTPETRELEWPDVRDMAMDALVQIDDPVTTGPIMIDVIQMEDRPEYHMRAVEQLVKFKLQKSVDPLMKLLPKASQKELKLAIVEALVNIGDDRCCDVLVEKLKDPSNDLQMAIIAALKDMGSPNAIDGLVYAIGDRSARIRNQAQEALKTLGSPAVKKVTMALSDENVKARISAVEFLTDVNKIPSSGNDYIWFELAKATQSSKQKLSMDLVNTFLEKGDEAVPALLEAAIHPEPKIRKYAVTTLELMGSDCVKQAMAAAEKIESPLGLDWFYSRTTWAGYPSEKLDLWAALTAMNPDFLYNESLMTRLKELGEPAYRFIADKKFTPTRPYIPILIEMLDTTFILNQVAADPMLKANAEQTEEGKEPKMTPAQKRALREARNDAEFKLGQVTMQLKKAGEDAIIPLIAALGDDKAEIRAQVALLLADIDDPRAYQPMIDALEKEIEMSEEELTDSLLYEAVQQLGLEDAEPTLKKIRPSQKRVERYFEMIYPSVAVQVSKPANIKIKGENPPVLYTVFYATPNKNNCQYNVVFQKDEEGNWVPKPELPEEVPE